MESEPQCASCGGRLCAGRCLDCDRRRRSRFVHRELILLMVLVGITAVAFFTTRIVARHNGEASRRHALAWFGAAHGRVRDGQPEAAVTALRRAVARDPDNRLFRLTLAQALIASRHNAEARRVLLALHQAQPEDADASVQLARLEADGPDSDAARRYYQAALAALWRPAQADDQRRVRTELIEFLVARDQRDRALSELIVLAAGLPDDAEMQTRAGQLFLDAGDPQRASELFSKALQFDPEYPPAVNGAGRAAFVLGDYGNALRYLGSAPPEDASAAMREVASLVLNGDPLAPRLQPMERLNRLRAGFQQASRTLDDCLAVSAVGQTPLAALRAEADTLAAALARPRRALPRDQVDDGMDLIYRIEALVERECSRPPAPLDRALLLIGRRHRLDPTTAEPARGQRRPPRGSRPAAGRTGSIEVCARAVGALTADSCQDTRNGTTDTRARRKSGSSSRRTDTMRRMSTDRLLIVSNRLPVMAHADADGVRLADSEGGLATGLRVWHSRAGGLWIGWPGDVSPFTSSQRAELDRQLQSRGVVPVHLSKDQIDRYYQRFSNGVLWPLFHYLIDRVPVDTVGWDAYREVNEVFADRVAAAYEEGDVIWVHDFQLLLLPTLLRERLPHARIGFFLHVPFPSSEVFRTLPWRRQILQGLLGADLIGFHTFAYLRHFVASLLHVDGVETNVDTVRVGSRDVALGVFPMGIDATAFAGMARDPEIIAAAAALRADADGRRVVLGIDRLDYTKGIPRRLSAIERLLTEEPSLRDTMRYVQVAVPSRGGVESYQTFRHQVEQAVGRINGSCATLRSTPIHYIHRSISPRELVSLYLAADVMLVTPLRDGMNLVAKEFVASRVDDDGVLVLSEFAGAAAELGDAVVVNPYDVDAMVAAIHRALAMPGDERRRRMRRLRSCVSEYDVHAWAGAFMTRLTSTPTRAEPMTGTQAPLAATVAAARRGATMHLLLDYDGTLVPIAETPELATPDAELRRLLKALVECDGVEVHLVSGRPRAWLDQWFGDLPVALWAEHGFWHRAVAGAPWHASAPATPAWMAKVMPILQQFADSTPGALIEKKDASLAWHYRQADAEFGARQAHELRMLLGDALSNQPLEVLEGQKVIEIRRRGVSKAAVAHRSLFHDDAIVAVGDDRTDEELFNALPSGAITIAVGAAPTVAKYRVADYRAVRELLWALVLARRTQNDEPAHAVH